MATDLVLKEKLYRAVVYTWVKTILVVSTLSRVFKTQQTIIKNSFIDIRNKTIVTFFKEMVLPYRTLKKLISVQNTIFNTKR